MDEPHLRIGALSERVGVSRELLRAWEQRYGLLQPLRSDGGFRLYSSVDEQRVRAMRRHLDAGVSAAQAARLALAEPLGDEAVSSTAVADLPGERHGRSVTYLGPDTPVATVREALAALHPALVVISATTGQRLRAAKAELAELALEVPVALAGAGCIGEAGAGDRGDAPRGRPRHRGKETR